MDPPSFSDLYQRYAFNDVSLSTVVRFDEADQCREAQNLVRYLNSFGFRISTTADLFDAIQALEGEEELAAFRCHEGVAVSHASDGWWILFEEPPVGASSS